jgi:hypothetical protein
MICLYAPQATISHLTRSSLYRCLQRNGIGRLPGVEGENATKKKFKACSIGRKRCSDRTFFAAACRGTVTIRFGGSFCV